MKNPAIISGLILCAALIPAATAQQNASPRSAFNLLQHDANQDGRLTFEEYNTSLQQQFARIDGDGNGVSTPAERETARELMQTERVAERFAMLDTNADGRLSVEEFSARPDRNPSVRRIRGERAPARAMRRQGRDRANADSADISYADFSTRRIERFDTLDQNDDRILTQDELHAAANAPRQGRR